jgi:hypothetical protein
MGAFALEYERRTPTLTLKLALIACLNMVVQSVEMVLGENVCTNGYSLIIYTSNPTRTRGSELPSPVVSLPAPHNPNPGIRYATDPEIRKVHSHYQVRYPP